MKKQEHVLDKIRFVLILFTNLHKAIFPGQPVCASLLFQRDARPKKLREFTEWKINFFYIIYTCPKLVIFYLKVIMHLVNGHVSSDRHDDVWFLYSFLRSCLRWWVFFDKCFG